MRMSLHYVNDAMCIACNVRALNCASAMFHSRRRSVFVTEHSREIKFKKKQISVIHSIQLYIYIYIYIYTHT